MPRDRRTVRTLQANMQLPEPNVAAERLGTAPEVNPSPRVEHALLAVRPRAVRPCSPEPSFFTDLGSELTTHGLARMQASHLRSELEFRVRVQEQMIGGETRGIQSAISWCWT